MYHVALIDITSKAIGIAEEYEDKGERDTRAGHLALQAELNEKGLNPDVKPGGDWRVVTGEEPADLKALFPEAKPEVGEAT